jgi:hypothetical protein
VALRSGVNQWGLESTTSYRYFIIIHFIDKVNVHLNSKVNTSPFGAVVMESVLKKEFEYYLANQDELVRKYNGQYIAIKNREVIGVFDDESTAVAETAKKHQLGTFLVQKVEPGSGAYTQTYHSRVLFAH